MYDRFLGQIVILAPTRRKIRKTMALVQVTLSRLLLDMHPDKTFIGCIPRRFDFLGCHFRDGVVSGAGQIVARMKETAVRFTSKRGVVIKPHPLGSISNAGTDGSGVCLVP